MKIKLRKGLVAYDIKNNLSLDGTIINCGCKSPRLFAIGVLEGTNFSISTVECRNCGNVISVRSEWQEDEEV